MLTNLTACAPWPWLLRSGMAYLCLCKHFSCGANMQKMSSFQCQLGNIAYIHVKKEHVTKLVCSLFLIRIEPVESKTRTHHERVGSGGARWGGWAGRARQDGTPTGLSAQDTNVPRALQGIEDNCPEHLFGSTNKGIPM